MPISLVFDTETTSAKNKKDHTDPSNPKCVQLYAAMYEHDDYKHYLSKIIVNGVTKPYLFLKPIQMVSCIVMMNDDENVEEGAFKVHGISRERTQEVGVLRKSAANIFADMLDVSDRLVAHNVEFDKKIIRHMLHQTKIDPGLVDKPQSFCTMNYLRPKMQLTPKMFGDWKNPKLIEGYNYLFGRDFDGAAHDASVDAVACADIYFEILNIERLKIEEAQKTGMTV